MDESQTRKSVRIFSQSTALAVAFAGAVGASAALFFLPSQSRPVSVSINANPVVKQTLKDARKLQAGGKWKQSAELLRPYATSQNPYVLLEYGKLLSRGWGVPRNLEKAREKLLLAVQQDFPKRGQAAFELAKVFRKSSGRDCARIAFEWFTKAANWGFSKAHAELGRHHARGIGVPVNFRRALDEFQIASRSGSAGALISFLKLISKDPKLGRGLPSLDELVADAIPLLEREALKGRASSAKALGRLYLDEALLKPNKAKAEVWLRRGADLGDSGAMCDLALLLLEGLPARSNVTLALEMLRQAVALKNAGATTELGRLHLNERFGLKREGAVDLFKKGIWAAHPGSMFEMARLHLTGELVVKSEERARALLKRGAALGHEGSSRLLRKLSNPEIQNKPVAKSSAAQGSSLPGKRRLSGTRSQNNILLNRPLNGATVITPFGRKG